MPSLSSTIPNKFDDVNTAWLESILSYEISPLNFQVEEGIQSGSGNMSNMIRVHCETREGQKLHLVVKLLPAPGIYRDVVISEKLDKTEIQFYKRIVPELLEIVPDVSKYLCKSLYAEINGEGQDHASVLVLEDWKPEGYYTINFEEKCTREQIRELMNFMSIFHFGGFVLEDKVGQKLNKYYDFLQVADNSVDSMFNQMVKNGLVALQNSVLKNSPASVQNAYRRLVPHSDKIITLIQNAGEKIPCLIHGDLWSSNLLFNNDSHKHTMVIDWQILSYRDQTFDVAVAILTTLPQDQLTKTAVDELLTLYYSGFMGQFEANGGKMKHLIKRSWEELREFFYTWAIGYSFIWFLVSAEMFALDNTKLVGIYEFMATELDIPKFLLNKI